MHNKTDKRYLYTNISKQVKMGELPNPAPCLLEGEAKVLLLIKHECFMPELRLLKEETESENKI